MAGKKVKNFRGLYAEPTHKMSIDQLRAYIDHNWGEKLPAEKTRAELLAFIEEQEQMEWADYRDKLIAEEAENNKRAGKTRPQAPNV
jgi:hypothetical protein